MKLSIRLLIIFVILTLSIVGCSSDDKTDNNDTQKEEEVVEESLQVNYTYSFTKKNSLLVIIENSNDIIVNSEITVTYYDENKTVVRTDVKNIEVVDKNAKSAKEFYDVPENASDFNIEVVATEVEGFTSYAKVLDVIPKDLQNNIEITVNNDSQSTLNVIDIGVIFYSNQEVVAYESFRVDGVENGSKTVYFIDYPKDVNNSIILFDDYEIIVNEAYW